MNKLQREALTRHGFYQGPISEKADKRAVQRFQRAYWGSGITLLKVDGIVGPKTSRALTALPHLSNHFVVSELWDWRESDCGIRRELVGALEALRRHVGKPLVITSGYRSPDTNNIVKGKPESLHLAGLAVDLKTRIPTSTVRSLGAFSGIGSKHSWVVHIDLRHVLGAENPTPGATPRTPARWTY